MLSKILQLNKSKYYQFLLAVILLLCTQKIVAHGSLTIRIQEKTIEIAKDSLNAELYFERGYLYQQHHEFQKAIEDYSKAQKYGYKNKIIHFYKSETFLEMGNIVEALKSSNVYLKAESKDPKIYKLRAKIFYAKGDYSKALFHYQYISNNMNDIRPSDFIEYATIFLEQNPENYKKALEIIDKGLKKLGNKILTLNLKKLQYLHALKDENRIIEQYNYFIVSSKRKEHWYFKKASYLITLEKNADANIALQQSKMAITLLKPKTKNTLAVKKLVIKINELENSITL